MLRDFRPFFVLKDLTCAPYEQTKTVSRTFSFSQRYSMESFKKEVFMFFILLPHPNTFFGLIVPLRSVRIRKCPHSHCRVHVVNDYFSTCSHQLFQHIADMQFSKVSNYIFDTCNISFVFLFPK